MARIALTLMYLIAAVCGPRPCCCAAPANPVQPVKPAPPKCPLCAAAAKKPDPPEPAKRHDCPCQKSRPAATPHAAPAPTDDGRQVSTDGPFGVPVAAVHLTAATVTDPRTPGPPPDPSAHLPLLCHRLRC